MRRSLLVLALVSLAVVASAATAAAQDGGACPYSFAAAGVSDKAEFTCHCSDTAGDVWGTDTYTADSSICGAAMHAGLVSASGGNVTVRGTAGCNGYAGSTRNNRSTSSWGPYQTSFFFPAASSGSCGEGGAPAADACPATFKDGGKKELTCTCGPGSATGAVWGYHIYTTDSSVCAAAVQDGVIPAAGGQLTAKKTGGCDNYEGANQNGVTSSSWKAYEASFYFPATGTASCPKGGLWP